MRRTAQVRGWKSLLNIRHLAFQPRFIEVKRHKATEVTDMYERERLYFEALAESGQEGSSYEQRINLGFALCIYREPCYSIEAYKTFRRLQDEKEQYSEYKEEIDEGLRICMMHLKDAADSDKKTASATKSERYYAFYPRKTGP